MLSDILAATFDSEDTIEAISTEDMLSKIEGLNKRIQEGEISPRNLIVGSLDVKVCSLVWIQVRQLEYAGTGY